MGGAQFKSLPQAIAFAQHVSAAADELPGSSAVEHMGNEAKAGLSRLAQATGCDLGAESAVQAEGNKESEVM